MNSKFYRTKVNFISWLKKKPEISELDNNIYNIAKKLITTSDTKLILDTLEPKYYIKSDRQKIVIIIEEKKFIIVYDKTNYYDITVSSFIANKTVSLFKKIQQRRAQKMENDILSNVNVSLSEIKNRIHE